MEEDCIAYYLRCEEQDVVKCCECVYRPHISDPMEFDIDSVEKGLLLSELGHKQLAAGCTDEIQQSGASVVQPYSYKISRVVALIVLLLLFSFVGPCYVSASSNASCDQLQFCPNHYWCQPWHDYRQAITGTDKSTWSWKEDIDEEPVKTSQPQTEFETSSSPLTQSAMTSTNGPVKEYDANPPLKDSDIDSLAHYYFTKSNLEDISNFQNSTSGRDYVWMMLGVTGAGKSCLGNFILRKDNMFPEASVLLISTTQKASVYCTVFNSQRLCVIDTPGFRDALRIGTHVSEAMDIANDASHVIIEFTRMMMLTKTGISAFFIVVPLHHRDYAGLQRLLDFIDILGNFWNHSIVVFTHGTVIGGTEDDQYKMFTDLLQDADGPPILIDLVKKVNDRFVIVEAKDWRSDTAYRNGVVTKLLSLSDDITQQHGRYQDSLQSIGREAYEKAKLEFQNKFEDIDSPEANAAIFQSTFSHVRVAVLKLVRIKLADGKDVDKLKLMNELKEKMLEEIRKQRDQLYTEFLEEEKRRKEAEEEQKRIEEERHKEEQRRKQGKEEQHIVEERRRLAEEQKLKEQREKEEAQRKLEEYLKKPTFNERRIKVEVTHGNFYRWEWVYSAKAVDVATGISAEAQNYASKGGAKEHAREDLKAILLERGIIRKDDI